jgi:hypothetical protein
MHLALNKCVPGVLTIQDLDDEIKEVHAEKNQKQEFNGHLTGTNWNGVVHLGRAGTRTVFWER